MNTFFMESDLVAIPVPFDSDVQFGEQEVDFFATVVLDVERDCE
jgi:hypothetical protein